MFDSSSFAEFLNLGNESSFISTSDLMDLFTTLVEFESWHGFDTCCLSTFSVCINIKLEQSDTFIFAIKSNKNWTDSLAWWAPGSSKVDYYKTFTFNSGLVFSEISEHFNHFDFLFVVLFLIYNLCKSLSLNNISFIG